MTSRPGSHSIMMRSSKKEGGIMIAEKEKAAFICVKDTIDGAYPSLVLGINAARQGMESCSTCHQQTECLACHSAKQGWRVNPHGPDFDPERAADRSTQSCAICHTGY